MKNLPRKLFKASSEATTNGTDQEALRQRARRKLEQAQLSPEEIERILTPTITEDDDRS